MSVNEWIVAYVLSSLFWIWIIWWGGAKWLEGTFASGFLISRLAPKWDSEGIKLFAWGWFFVTTVVFIAGLIHPDFRQLQFL